MAVPAAVISCVTVFVGSLSDAVRAVGGINPPRANVMH